MTAGMMMGGAVDGPAPRQVETLVLGGGPAGASAAIRLAERGRPVELWERELTPGNRNCGDFLGAAALGYLADLGLDPRSLGAVPITGLRLLAGGRNPVMATARLGFPGWGLTRRLLDTALLRRAEEAGVVVRRGVMARGFTRDGVAEAVRERVRAAHLLLATGRPPLEAGGVEAGEAAAWQRGFRWTFRLGPEARAALAGHLELALLPQGRALLHPVEREAASLSVLVGPQAWAHCNGRAEALLGLVTDQLPLLGERLAAAVPLLDRPVTIETGLRARRFQPDRGRQAIWELGDLAASIPGLPGDGIGLALHGARLASAAILTGGGQSQYGRRLQRDMWRLRWGAALFLRLAEDGPWQQRAVRAIALAPPLAALAFTASRLGEGAVRRARLS